MWLVTWYQLQFFWNDVQTIFLTKLINILKRRWLSEKVINIKLQKIDDFSQSQKVSFVPR